MNALWWVIWSLGGGTLAGWLANRVIAFYLDHPIAFDADFSIEPLIDGILGNPLFLDQRTMWAFWAGLGILVLTGMSTYDYGG